MKKNYTSLFIIVTLILSNCCTCFAQMTVLANDDVGEAPSGTISQIVLANVIANDSIFGQSIVLPDVELTQVSTSNPAIQLQPDGSVLLTGGPLPDGAYTLDYQICSVATADFCDSAEVTIFIGVCHSDAPILGDVTGLACNSAATTVIYGLPPATNWTLQIMKNGVFVDNVNGNGTATALSFTSAGNYAISLANDGFGCISPAVYVFLSEPPVCGFHMLFNGAYNDFNSNGLLDAGDTINYNFNVINNASGNLSGVSITSGTINISGGPIATLNQNTSDNSTFNGVYALTQNDIDLGYVTHSATATASVNAQQIQASYANTVYLPNIRGFRLIAFVDSNNNGVFDSGERSFNRGHFTYEINNDGMLHYPTWFESTNFIFENNPVNSYDIAFTVNAPFAAYYTPSINSVSNISVGAGISTFYFPVTEIPYVDSYVYLLPYNTLPLPGSIYRNLVVYGNNSNTTIASGTLSFTKDNLLAITNISETSAVATPTGFTYNFTNLLPDESRYLIVTFQVPPIPTVMLGNNLANSVQITIPPGDINPPNNSAMLSSFITGSYDPNGKTENHGGKIVQPLFNENDFLTYTIHFENTGTAPALNVVVNDILDDSLDENSVEMVDASRQCVMERTANNLEWKFDGINLPPSDGVSDAGTGYVSFRVKPKPGYSVGDIIPNTANIFFDFNPAITTDVCTTEFVSTLAVASFTENDFTVYPNPTTEMVNISSTKEAIIDSILVTDILGKTVFGKQVNSTESSVDLSQLQSGIYFAKVFCAGKTAVLKLVKK